MDTVTKNGNRRHIITPLKAGYLLIVIAISLTILSAGVTEHPPQQKQYVVVIDAGHGGRDPGALGSSSREKDIVLAIALKTGNYIMENFKDVKVIYTRDKDVFVDLDKRAEIANKNHADLFISIHTNSIKAGGPRSPVGTETFVLGTDKENANLAVAMKENSVIEFEEDYSKKYEGYDPKSPESFIIFSLMQNIYHKQSLDFASLVQEQFRVRVGRTDRGVKQAGFLVLWMTSMPSVLIEAGFISNPAEEQWLKSSQGQDHVASAIYRAFRDYKSEIDKKSSFNAVRAEPVVVTAIPAVEQADNNIFFTIQIAATREKKELAPASFKGLNDLSEFASDGRYRYTAGRFKSYQDAVTYRKSIADKYPDAFVIAFKGTNIVPLREALEIANRK
jgi:N-acetylmuramoyl-L-alanine amidase